MNEERERVRCQSCELVQWSDQAKCRRCGSALPEPIVKVVERVVEKIVIRHDSECLENLDEARKLIAQATDRLTQPIAESVSSPVLAKCPEQVSDDRRGGAGDDRGSLSEIESQASRSGAAARNRENDVLPEA